VACGACFLLGLPSRCVDMWTGVKYFVTFYGWFTSTFHIDKYMVHFMRVISVCLGKKTDLSVEAVLRIINTCELYISNCEIGRIVTTGTMI
jgi:hypothetical protein